MLTDSEALTLEKLLRAGYVPGTVVCPHLAFWGRMGPTYRTALRRLARGSRRFRLMPGGEAYRVMPGAFEGLADWKAAKAAG